MTAKANYISGQKIGNFIYLYEAGTNSNGRRQAMFKCHCGKKIICQIKEVKSLHSKSCGCTQYKIGRNNSSYKHGFSGTSEFIIWYGIKDRCYRKRNHAYKYYGARGIKVCKRWRDSFLNFYNDMGKRPSKKHSVERINNNGGYEPSNCKWATALEQSRNNRHVVRITLNNETYCISEWAEKYNIPHTTVRRRMGLGWDFEKALNIPLRKRTDKRNRSKY